MHETTASHPNIDTLLSQSRLATAIAAGFLVAAVILGTIAFARAWPPPALQQREAAAVHS